MDRHSQVLIKFFLFKFMSELRIVFMGPQGAGKGTQAELIAKHFNIPMISTGEMYRKEIEKQTDLGKIAASYINQGKLVPDEITNDLIKLRIVQPDCQKGFVIDGYPRNAIQLGVIESVVQLTHVLEIDISDNEAIRRLSGRRVCLVCGKNYHLDFNPPEENKKCDECKAHLIIREDDRPEAISERLDIYHRETEPLSGFYRGKGILRKINGEQTIKKVFEDILKALAK